MTNVNSRGLDFLLWECGMGLGVGSRQSHCLGGGGTWAAIPAVCVLCVWLCSVIASQTDECSYNPKCRPSLVLFSPGPDCIWKCSLLRLVHASVQTSNFSFCDEVRMVWCDGLKGVCLNGVCVVV